MEQKILDGEIGYDLLLSDFEGQESILINSPGGSLFEGLAMYDYVQGNNIEVGVIGVSASAATLPLIASEKRWGTPNSRYLIHNPWSFAVGDAEAVDKTAKELKSEQERALNLYVQHLNGSKEELQTLMNEERIIDADEALQLGLIKEIRQINEESESDKPEGADIKNLFTQFKMKYEMKKEKEESSSISTKLDELKSMISNLFSPKNIIIQDTAGVEIDFGSGVETADQVAVGNTNVTVDGSPANGTHTIAEREGLKGGEYVFEEGELKEIREPEAEEDADMTALKEENEQLKQQLSEVQNNLETVTGERDGLKTSFGEVKSKYEVIETEFTEFKNKFSDDKPEDKTPEDGKPAEKKAGFDINKVRNQK